MNKNINLYQIFQYITQVKLNRVLVQFLYYLYNYYIVCVLLSHTHHVMSP